MKKKLNRPIYLFFVLVILFFVLNSCSTVSTPSTGIVTIDLDIGYILGIDLERPAENYYIYMDDVFQGTMIGSGAFTIPDVPIGMHEFDAYNYMIVGIDGDIVRELKEPMNGGSICSGTVSHLVETGINYVTIPVYCSPATIMVE